LSRDLSLRSEGVFLLVFAFILFFALTVLYFGKARHHKKWIKNFLKIVFLILIFISFYAGINATVERFSLDKLLQEERPVVWANTLGVFSDFPLFGTGLGTFASLYPSYEDSEKFLRYSHAHNDYLEYLSELGVFGFIFLFGGIFFMLINSFLIWRVRRHPIVKGLSLGGIIAIVCILIHSITDFNLQIPANMMLFSVVLSLAIVTAFYKKNERNNKIGKNKE